MRWPTVVPQVHYDDAAAAAVAALLRAPRGETLHVADDEPLSRHAICVQACRAPQFADRTIPSFTGAGGRGKVIDSSHTRAVLEWEPRYRTFGAFITAVIDEAAAAEAAEEKAD